MPQMLDADVALIHVAGGEARLTAPPGTLAQSPPRRAARGRSEDMLFVSLSLAPARAHSPALLDQLAHQAAHAFYGTPGSVTSALREAAAEVNDHLVEANRSPEAAGQLQGRMIAAALRGPDLYLCQCGLAQAILIRPGQVTRLVSEEAASRPLGMTATPFVRYHHLEVRPGDLILLTCAPPPGWSDPTLSALSGLDPAQALDRLVAATTTDLTGILLRPTQLAASPSPLPAQPAPPAPTAARPQPLRPTLTRPQPPLASETTEAAPPLRPRRRAAGPAPPAPHLRLGGRSWAQPSSGGRRSWPEASLLLSPGCAGWRRDWSSPRRPAPCRRG